MQPYRWVSSLGNIHGKGDVWYKIISPPTVSPPVQFVVIVDSYTLLIYVHT